MERTMHNKMLIQKLIINLLLWFIKKKNETKNKRQRIHPHFHGYYFLKLHVGAKQCTCVGAIRPC